MAGHLILASASPRRRELLAEINVQVDAVRPTEQDETALPSELPRELRSSLGEIKGGFRSRGT